MHKSIVLLLVLLFLTCSCIIVSFPVKAGSRTIVVPDDFVTIQTAVDRASEGDTVFVKSGNYSGSVFINKSLSLIGEDKDTTIISDWRVNGTAAILIRHDNVTVSGFTINNTSPTTIWNRKRGIHLLHVSNCNISNNNILRSDYGIGIWLYGSSRNIILGNTVKSGISGIRFDSSSENRIFKNIIKNNREGIAFRGSDDNIISANYVVDNTDGLLLHGSQGNTFHANEITSNDHGLRIGDYEYGVTHVDNNTFYHNNFIGNDRDVGFYSYFSYLVAIGVVYFDDGMEGNYWGNYMGSTRARPRDDNGDGIGDVPYVIYTKDSLNYHDIANLTDHYPLMAPFDISSVSIDLPQIPSTLFVRLISPITVTYASANFTLEFAVNKPTSWMGYTLDGLDNVTVTGNTTITAISSGFHNITVYAKDIYGRGAASETICFTLAKEAETEPFPVIWVAAAVLVSVAVFSVGLIIFFKKRALNFNSTRNKLESKNLHEVFFRMLFQVLLLAFVVGFSQLVRAHEKRFQFFVACTLPHGR